MRISEFLGIEPLHFDPDQQVAFNAREDSGAYRIVKEVSQERDRFMMRVLAGLGLTCLLLREVFLVQKRRLLSPGPPECVSAKTTGEKEGKLSVDWADWSGRGKFQEIGKCLLGDVFGGQLFVPGGHLAEGAMDGGHEGEHQNRLSGFRAGWVGSKKEQSGQNVIGRGWLPSVVSLSVEMLDER